MNRTTASKARQDFSNILNRTAYKGERIIIQKRGKDFVAVVPLEDVEYLQRLEDEEDLRAAKDALKERGSYSLEEVKEKLGLK
jgi:prevent-host-death family protein